MQTPDGTPFGFNPGLQALYPLWGQGRLAVLANTGMLVQPVTRTEFLTNAVPLPTNLFSHADQMQQMQSGIPSTSGGTGWGGRAADVMQPLNGTSSFPDDGLDQRSGALLQRPCRAVGQSVSRLQPRCQRNEPVAAEPPPTRGRPGCSRCCSSTAGWRWCRPRTTRVRMRWR